MSGTGWWICSGPLPPRGGGVGRGGDTQGISYGFHDGIELLEDLIVPESHDPEPLGVQPCRPGVILLRLGGMLTAIQFEDQFGFEADEIDNVISDGSLPSKFAPVEAIGPEFIPHSSLGVGHGLAELSCEVAGH